MWINVKDDLPKTDGAYYVYTDVNIGTEHECKEKYIAYWDNNSNLFWDKTGDEPVGINSSVFFWFDIDETMIPDSSAGEYFKEAKATLPINSVVFSEERAEVCDHYFEPTVLKGKIYCNYE